MSILRELCGKIATKKIKFTVKIKIKLNYN